MRTMNQGRLLFQGFRLVIILLQVWMTLGIKRVGVVSKGTTLEPDFVIPRGKRKWQLLGKMLQNHALILLTYCLPFLQIYQLENVQMVIGWNPELVFLTVVFFNSTDLAVVIPNSTGKRCLFYCSTLGKPYPRLISPISGKKS